MTEGQKFKESYVYYSVKSSRFGWFIILAATDILWKSTFWRSFSVNPEIVIISYQAPFVVKPR